MGQAAVSRFGWGLGVGASVPLFLCLSLKGHARALSYRATCADGKHLLIHSLGDVIGLSVGLYARNNACLNSKNTCIHTDTQADDQTDRHTLTYRNDHTGTHTCTSATVSKCFLRCVCIRLYIHI